jgi:hypothetical protein
VDQSAPWRNDRQWFTHLLEPGTPINQLQNVRDPVNNRVLQYSYMRYTCDEFPPATWRVFHNATIGRNALSLTVYRIEGGNGLGGTQAANTRCAALQCRGDAQVERMVKAEQNCRSSCLVR